jgi:DNA polymerase (family 10)
MTKLEIAERLREIGALFRLKGDNPFRARAYESGAEALEDLEDDLEVLITEQRLTETRGIGAALAAVIVDLATTGRSSVLEHLRAEMPPGIIELSQVPGLTTRRIQALHEALGITDIDQLRAAAEGGRIQQVKGFGPTTEAKILEGIARYRERPREVLLVEALEVGGRLLSHLRRAPEAIEVALAGAARRWRETVDELPMVAAARAGEASTLALVDRFLRFPSIASVELRGDGRCAARLATGLRVTLEVVDADHYAGALHRLTGSARHRGKLAPRATAAGIDLDALVVSSEDQLYQRLGLHYIPPELREDEGEIEHALAGSGFDDLLAVDDIQGMVHCHTVYSDGRNSIEEMARAAQVMGMKYLTITDHSPSASYAGGVALDRLARQWDEIAEVQERVEVKLLRGTESDILADGRLDYPDRVLESFDVIIASIHGRMKMDADQMTRRLVQAMRQPWFKIWGHALGRLVQRRPPIECRVEEVLDAVAQSRAAIEINGDPYRLDMEPRWLREARKRGIPFVVSTDAHSLGDLENLRFGVAMARRAGVRKGEVLNAQDPAAFTDAVRPS